MGWLVGVVVLSLLLYIAVAAGFPHTIDLPQNFIDEDIHRSLDNIGEDESEIPIKHPEDVTLDHLGRLLTNILVQPWPKGISPILYVENYPTENTHENPPLENEVLQQGEFSNAPFKRSRYYRKYPWKRQNSRYDAENKYLCQPSKEDVFRLLVALHEARRGSRGQMVNFCNRKRPASAIFTNIRFLG